MSRPPNGEARPRPNPFGCRPMGRNRALSIEAGNTIPQLRSYKYHHHHSRTDSIMNTTDDQLESTDDDELETQKALIRQSLDQIAKEVGIAMRDVHI